MNGWQAIKKAPSEGDILVYVESTKEMFVAYEWGDGYFAYALRAPGSAICCEPTHWMPLPAAPDAA